MEYLAISCYASLFLGTLNETMSMLKLVWRRKVAFQVEEKIETSSTFRNATPTRPVATCLAIFYFLRRSATILNVFVCLNLLVNEISCRSQNKLRPSDISYPGPTERYITYPGPTEGYIS